jgi:hypothetical protein
VIERLLEAVSGATAPTEADSERDGLLSYSKEWHALIVGFGAGMVAGLSGSWELAVTVVAMTLAMRAAPGPLKQLRREPWYALGGVVTGTGFGVVLSTVAASV